MHKANWPCYRGSIEVVESHSAKGKWKEVSTGFFLLNICIIPQKLIQISHLLFLWMDFWWFSQLIWQSILPTMDGCTPLQFQTPQLRSQVSFGKSIHYNEVPWYDSTKIAGYSSHHHSSVENEAQFFDEWLWSRELAIYSNFPEKNMIGGKGALSIFHNHPKWRETNSFP